MNKVFSFNHMGTYGLALEGDRCQLECPCPFMMCAFEIKGGITLQDTSYFGNFHFGIPYLLNTNLKNEATP